MVSDAVSILLDWPAVAKRLEADPDSIRWRDRESLLINHAEAFSSPTDEMLAVLEFLARDAKWEVRQRVAELLDRLPEESFGGLAAQLS